MSIIANLFKRKHRRMTSYERNEAAKVKKAKKDAKKVSKKVASTLNWSHIYEITDNSIQLRKGKKQATVMGVKLSPHDIFIDDPEDQARIIENLRMALNKLPFRMYYSFVYSPVNADDHIANLMDADRIETDPIVKQMIQADFDKLVQFQNAYAELEFFVMIQERSEERLHKYFQEMMREFELAGFLPRILNRYDFYNYLTYLYENPMINNFYFSRGVFSYLNQDIEYNEETNEYEVVDHSETFEDYGTYLPNIRPKENLIRRSKYAPTGFKLAKDYYILGDHYVSNLLVTALPATYELGCLLEHINNPKVKVMMVTEKLDMAIAQLLRKDYLEKEREMNSSRDEYFRTRRMAELESEKAYIEQIVRDNDLTLNLTIIFSIYADTYEELERIKKNVKASLNTKMFITQDLKLMQEMLLKIGSPLFLDDGGIPETIRENIGIPLPARGVAGLYPFVFETLKDPSGFLLGSEYYNGGIICFDPFYWLHEHHEAVQLQRLNGNIIVIFFKNYRGIWDEIEICSDDLRKYSIKNNELYYGDISVSVLRDQVLKNCEAKLLEDKKAGEEEKLRREQKKIEQENRQKQIEFEWKQQQLKVQRERQQNRQLLEEKESIHQEPEVISKCKTIVTDNPKQEDFLDEETKVVSKEGQRYLLCTRCNKIKKSIAFSSIDFIPGSKERSNRGICRECEDSFCPRCGKKLIKRNGKHGEFFGCSGYPNCRFTKSIY